MDLPELRLDSFLTPREGLCSLPLASLFWHHDKVLNGVIVEGA